MVIVAFVVAFVACVPALTYAQYPRARTLWTTMQVKDGLRLPEGLSFELFGRPSSIEFVVVVVNDSSDTLIFPSSFTAGPTVRVERAGRGVPARTAWERVEVALPDDDPSEMSSVTSFTVAPQGVVRFHGVVTPAGLDSFGPGDYTVLLNLRSSLAAVRDGTGERWTGHYADEGSFAVRVTEPRTPAEHRRANIAAANAALLRGHAAVALRHSTEMLRADPNDGEALSASGVAYLELHRYCEAAAAFERVIPSVQEERTMVYEDAAAAYLACGQDARAEAILANRYGAADGKRRLAQLREAARKR